MGYDMKVAAIEDILPGKFGHILTRKDERVNVKKIWQIFFFWLSRILICMTYFPIQLNH